MDTITVEQAAALLHLNVKRVQAMARDGKLPASRVGRKWLFRRADLDRLLGGPAPGGAGSGSSCSARATACAARSRGCTATD